MVEFRAGGASRAVRHRFAGVEHEPAGEVGFVLELLEVVPVAAAKDFPVDVPHVIASHVFPVLGKFGRESLQAAAMSSGHRSLEPAPRLESQSTETGLECRVDQVVGFRHGRVGERLSVTVHWSAPRKIRATAGWSIGSPTGVSWSSQSITSSGETRSDSALKLVMIL